MKKLAATLGLIAALSPISADAQTAYSYSHLVGATTLTLNGSTTINNASRGWCESTGGCNGGGAGNNYIIGDYYGSNYRNWFTFDIPDIGLITSAVFGVNAAEVYGTDVTVRFFDLAVSNAANGLAGYADMGAGSFYGQYTYNPSDNYTYTNVSLNGAALTDLNAAAGGSWATGGAVGSPMEVVATPEPASLVLLATGLLAIGATAAKRRRAAAR